MRPDFCEILPTIREMHEALGPGPKVCADVTACADIPTVLEMKCSHAAFSTVVVRRVGRFRVVVFYRHYVLLFFFFVFVLRSFF